MKKWTVRRLVLTGFTTVFMTFVILSGITGYCLIQSIGTSHRVDQSSSMILMLKQLKSGMHSITSAQQGYILTGSEELLARRDAAIASVGATLQQALRLAADDPDRHARLEQVGKMIAEREQASGFYEQLRRAGKLQSDGGRSDAGESISARLDDVFEQMEQHENSFLHQRRQEDHERTRAAWISAGALLVFVTSFLLGLLMLLSRAIRNEEASAALKKSESFLRQVLDRLPVGVFVADANGKPVMVNPAAQAIWAVPDGAAPDRSEDYTGWRLDDGSSAAPVHHALTYALRNGCACAEDEFQIACFNGSRKFIRSAANPLRGANGEIVGAIAVNMDVTNIKQIERALQPSHNELEARVEERTSDLMQANLQLLEEIEERKRAEEALHHIQHLLTSAERAGHVGSWEVNLVTRQARWSDEFFRICGLVPGSIEPTMDACLTLVHPDDRDAVDAAIRRTIEEYREYKVKCRVMRPDGSDCHVLVQGEIVRSENGRPSVLIGSMADITELQQAEDMLRRLAVHQERIKEEERKRIAREIHDEMGQNLLALRIDVEMLRTRTAGTHPRLHEKVLSVLDNIDNTIKSVRAIINNLRPAVLDLGLYAAIQWQLNEFQRRSGINCELSANPAELDAGLDDDQTTTLFRVLQESLTNVARHANASNVHISLERVSDKLFMKIDDDGIGVLPGTWSKPDSFGLVGIKERITAIGGDFRIDSRVGKGMALMLSIPVEPAGLKV